MPDLICLVANHGYSDNDTVYVSWLNDVYYVRSSDVSTQNASFKISTTADDDNIVQFTESVTDGFVRFDNGTGSATISGLDHLEGRLVSVTSGGELVGAETVSNGSITLPVELTTFQVGLPYTMKVRTMRLAIPQDNMTTQSTIKRINETVVRATRSSNGKAGVEYNGIEYLTDLSLTFSKNAEDNERNTRLSLGGFNEEAYTVVKSEDPVPFTVLATIINVEI